MANDFVSSEPNADLRRKIESVDDFESLREILKADLCDAKGVLQREQDGNFSVRENIVIQPPPPVNPKEATHIRVIYPHGQDRYEITGMSDAELNQKEAAIRNLYSAQR